MDVFHEETMPRGNRNCGKDVRGISDQIALIAQNEGMHAALSFVRSQVFCLRFPANMAKKTEDEGKIGARVVDISSRDVQESLVGRWQTAHSDFTWYEACEYATHLIVLIWVMQIDEIPTPLMNVLQVFVAYL